MDVVALLPAHGRHLVLLVGDGVGGALADPAAVRQQRSLLLHLVEDLLPLHLRLARLLSRYTARHCAQRGERNSTLCPVGMKSFWWIDPDWRRNLKKKKRAERMRWR